MEAVRDPGTQLSYHALIGTRKQSVADVEQIFSSSVLAFMEGKGYDVEARYVKVVQNWRRACDERGLSDEKRSELNQELRQYILDELMPWHKDQETCDFRQLEVNR